MDLHLILEDQPEKVTFVVFSFYLEDASPDFRVSLSFQLMVNLVLVFRERKAHTEKANELLYLVDWRV